MRRGTPEQRIEAILDSAIKLFMRYGYRRAQIADIAEAVGIAPGTIYRYVESKEALFDLALQQACGQTPLIDYERLPIASSTPEQILSRVDALFRGTGILESIRARQAEPDADTACAEFVTIVTQLYEAIARKHRGIGMIEASAQEWPELSELFYGLRRMLIADLTVYLQLRIGQGLLRPVPYPHAAARMILETISWFAYHRNNDPEPDTITDGEAAATAIDGLVSAFVMKRE
jgi:AcrR family transcriptional regulator